MHAIWGMGQAMFSKCIVVVDEDVDVQNAREVAWRALNNIDPQRDIEFVHGAGGFAGPLQPPAEFRLEDGHRRHAQVAGRRLYQALAGRDRDVARREAPRGRIVETSGAVGFTRIVLDFC